MASIFKRGKARKTATYWIQYRDHEGKRKTVKGYTDKGLTEQLAARLEDEARLRKTGMIDPEQERLAQQRHSELSPLLDKFEDSLADNTSKHSELTMYRVRRIVDGSGFQKLADITIESVQTYLRTLRRDEDLGHRTYNHYVQAFDSFCYWCVTTKRLLTNPIKGLPRLNTEVDVRHPRRALSPSEVSRLIDSARNSGRRVQNLPAEVRARIYLLSCMTGLQKKELASLTPNSFRLDDNPPTVTIEAACSKHRRKDVLPLHPELVARLRIWLKKMQPQEKLFPLLAKKKLSKMIQIDLKRAGIPYRTSEGIADFHAAGRHTYIAQLLRSRASLPEAKELARHTDVKMTMRYTHIGIEDQARAVASMPMPNEEEEYKSNPGALQMRCISGVSPRQSVSLPGKNQHPVKDANPLHGDTSVKDRRQVSSPDKAEGTGLEPACDIEGTNCAACVYAKCKQCGAANALHVGYSNCLYMASIDADLQSVIVTWSVLSDEVQMAIVSLLGP